MSEEFSRQVLKVVVAKICQPLGVHGMQSSVCETMTDVLKDYILTLARTASTYSSHGKCVAGDSSLGQKWKDGFNRQGGMEVRIN